MQNLFSKFKKNKPGISKEIKPIIIFTVALLLLSIFAAPAKFGDFGRTVREGLAKLIGDAGIFFIPLFFAYYGIRILKNKPLKLLEWILTTGIFLSALILLSLRTTANYGGKLGVFLYTNFEVFGPVGRVVLAIVILLYLVSLLFHISIIGLAISTVKILLNDWKQWQAERNLVRKPVIPQQTQGKQSAKIKPMPVIQKPQEKPDDSKSTVVVPPPVIVERKKETVIKPQSGKNVKYIPPPYNLPSPDLLTHHVQSEKNYDETELRAQGELLKKTLLDFNVLITIKEIIPGPVVTRFDLIPDPGVKVQSILALENDIALAMKAQSLRIVAPIPGKAAVGIEISNPKSRMIGMKDLVSIPEFINHPSKLVMALGQTTEGLPYITDLIPMPHLLIAGATGSGKSVCIHSIINSILFKSRPDEVKFLLIDPKRLEMPIYNNLPHVYDPRVPSSEKSSVITKPKDAADALRALVRIMNNRYERFAKATVRNIDGYNKAMEQRGEQKEFYIVVIIDELADLMLTLPREIEDNIQKLAQMARAVGIHLILATQRPSVDVITGVIKANLSSRIAFQVLSKTDSRVILDTIGAEDLLGRGDMLFLPTGAPKPIRLQGTYVSEHDVEQTLNFVKNQNFVSPHDDYIESQANEEDEEQDIKLKEYLREALFLVKERRRVSQDLLKAHFGSSARATDILSQLEIKGFIYKPEGTNRWQIYFDRIEEYLATTDENNNHEN